MGLLLFRSWCHFNAGHADGLAELDEVLMTRDARLEKQEQCFVGFCCFRFVFVYLCRAKRRNYSCKKSPKWPLRRGKMHCPKNMNLQLRNKSKGELDCSSSASSCLLPNIRIFELPPDLVWPPFGNSRSVSRSWYHRRHRNRNGTGRHHNKGHILSTPTLSERDTLAHGR